MINHFWINFIESTELERYKIIEQLPIKKDKNGFYLGFSDTVFINYLSDLIDTIEKNYEKGG